MWWLKKICPSVSPRRMNSESQAGHKGTPTSRSSKRAKRGRDRVRTWAQPSPLGHEWRPLCVGKRRTDGQLSHPEPSSAQAGSPPHQRHARTHQLSDLPPHRGALHQAKRRPKPSAPRWALSWGLRRAPKGCLAPGQPECNDRATRCETSLLERPRPRVHSAHAAGLWPAPSGQRPEESDAVNQYGPSGFELGIICRSSVGKLPCLRHPRRPEMQGCQASKTRASPHVPRRIPGPS